MQLYHPQPRILQYLFVYVQVFRNIQRIMGMNTSTLGGQALSTTQIMNLVMNKLYKQFVDKDVKDFDTFNVAIFDTFNTINMALPGKHYDAPSYEDVKDFFNQWKEANEEAKRNMFTDFMNKNVNLNKVDESMIVTGIVAPPAAMVAKRTGQAVPQLTFMKAIPDVVFVPSATVLALFAVRILGIMFRANKTTSKVATSNSHMDHETAVEPSTLNDSIPPPPVEQDEPVVEQDEPVVEPSSLNNIPPPPPVAAEDEPETAPAIQQHTAKGKFCALCNKFH